MKLSTARASVAAAVLAIAGTFGGAFFGSEVRITRHGRSASTFSTADENSAPLTSRLIGMTIARALISRASSTIRRPASPDRTFSQWPLTRRPPRTFARSIAVVAFDSWVGSCASIGALAGTVIVTST